MCVRLRVRDFIWRFYRTCVVLRGMCIDNFIGCMRGLRGMVCMYMVSWGFVLVYEDALVVVRFLAI